MRNLMLMRLLFQIKKLMSSTQELKALDEYVRRQLRTFLKQKQKMNEEPTQLNPRGEEEASDSLSSSSEDEPL